MKAYIIHVQYSDGRFDYVSAPTLDRFLSKNRVKRFFRPSEGRWVTVGVDPIRENVERTFVYIGPERRQVASPRSQISLTDF